MGDVGLAMQRAQDKTEQPQARAGALDGLIASGTLEDATLPAGREGGVQAQLDAVTSGQDVEIELARMKAQLPAFATPPITEGHLDRLNELDAALQSAADAGDEAAFTTSLSALLDAVRTLGTPLPDEMIKPSGLVLPDQDTSLRQVRDLLPDEGLIPG